MFHPDVGKQRAKARPANSVYRNVITICFPCTCVCTRLGSNCYLRLMQCFFLWVFIDCVWHNRSNGGNPCRCQSRPAGGPDRWKAITQKKYLEVFQLTIRSRSGVCRNSWSRLLAEFHFNTFEEAKFGCLFPLQEYFFFIFMPGNDAVQERTPEKWCRLIQSGLTIISFFN